MKQRLEIGHSGGLAEQVAKSVEQRKSDEDADREQAEQLDQGFERDGGDHAVMMFAGLDAAAAE